MGRHCGRFCGGHCGGFCLKSPWISIGASRPRLSRRPMWRVLFQEPMDLTRLQMGDRVWPDVRASHRSYRAGRSYGRGQCSMRIGSCPPSSSPSVTVETITFIRSLSFPHIVDLPPPFPDHPLAHPGLDPEMSQTDIEELHVRRQRMTELRMRIQWHRPRVLPSV